MAVKVRTGFQVIDEPKYIEANIGKKDSTAFDESMKTSEIVQNQIKLIVPFVFDVNYEVVTGVLVDNGWVIHTIDDYVLSKNLFSHSNSLITEQSANSTIGKLFRLSAAERAFYGLPSNEEEIVYLEDRLGEGLPFRIKDINLYVFETQISFLEIHVGDWVSGDTNISECTEKAVDLANLLMKGKLLRLNGSGTTSNFNLKPFIDNLSEILNITYFFDKTGNEPNRSLLYQSILAYHPQYRDSSEINRLGRERGRNVSDNRRGRSSRINTIIAEIGAELYKIRNRRNSTTLALNEELLIERNNPETLKLTRGTNVGLSLSGVGRIVIFSDVAVIGKYMHDLVRDYTYFYLYLLVLHQRYALLHMADLASNIPKTLDLYTESIKNNKTAITIDKIQERVTYFKLRCDFNQVSSDVQFAKYYDSLRKNLRIQEQLDELDEEMKTLSFLTRLKEQKEAEKQSEIQRQLLQAELRIKEAEEKRTQEEEKRKEQAGERKSRLQNIIFFITTVFVTVSTVADWIGIVQNYNGAIRTSVGTIKYFYLSGIIGFPLLLIGAIICYLLMEWRRKDQ